MVFERIYLYRKITKTSRTYIKMSSFKIRVIVEILLNSIVCFLQFSSTYIRVRLIIKVVVFSRFYGICLVMEVKGRHICIIAYGKPMYQDFKIRVQILSSKYLQQEKCTYLLGRSLLIKA